MKRLATPSLTRLEDKKLRYDAGLDLDLKTDISDLEAENVLKEISAPISIQTQIDEWTTKFNDFLTSVRIPKASWTDLETSCKLKAFEDAPVGSSFSGCKVSKAFAVGHLATGSLVFPSAMGNIRIHLEFYKRPKDLTDTKRFILGFLVKLNERCSTNALVSSSNLSYSSWSEIPSLVITPSHSKLSRQLKIRIDVYEEENTVTSEFGGFSTILQDELKRLLDSNENYKKASQILEIWIRQMNCIFPVNFSSTILLHCHITGHIYLSMKPWQIVRRVWSFLSNTKPKEEQIILGVEKCVPSRSPASLFLDRDGTTCLFPQLVHTVWMFLSHHASAALSLPFSESILTKLESGALFDIIYVFRGCNMNIPRISKDLEYGLGNRIVSMSGINNDDEKPVFRVGLRLNPTCHSLSATHGPEIGSQDVQQFREFWGERSELRRFEDGTVKELVVWGQQKEEIMGNIIRAIISRHHADVTVEEVGTWQNNVVIGDGGTKSKSELDSLSNVLYDLEGLTLAVSGVAGFGEEARISRVGTRTTSWKIGGKTVMDVAGVAKLSEKASMAPQFIQGLDVMLYPEYSGKWPKDSDAVRRLRVAWLIEVGKTLTTKMNGLKYKMIGENLLVITPSQEIILRFSVGEKGKGYSGHLCKLASWIFSLAKTYPAWSEGVRLAKRWVSSNLLSDAITETTVEVTMAKVFLNPTQFATAPVLPVSAFHRWLLLIATHDWNESPVLVTPDLVNSTQRSLLPNLAVISPNDPSPSYWTKPGPSWTELQRMISLASLSSKTLEQNDESGKWKKIFSPALDGYDFLIELKPFQVSNRSLNLFRKPCEEEPPQEKSTSVPVVEYNPAYMLLTELKLSYSHMANFYYDKYGGTVIAVKIVEDKRCKVKVSHLGGHIISGKEFEMNWGAIVEDWNIIGEGIIKNINCLNTELLL